jgi:hypothetical protein
MVTCVSTTVSGSGDNWVLDGVIIVDFALKIVLSRFDRVMECTYGGMYGRVVVEGLLINGDLLSRL